MILLTPAYTVLSNAPTCTPACASVSPLSLNTAGELSGTLNSVIGGQSNMFAASLQNAPTNCSNGMDKVACLSCCNIISWVICI